MLCAREGLGLLVGVGGWGVREAVEEKEEAGCGLLVCLPPEQGERAARPD